MQDSILNKKGKECLEVIFFFSKYTSHLIFSKTWKVKGKWKSYERICVEIWVHTMSVNWDIATGTINISYINGFVICKHTGVVECTYFWRVFQEHKFKKYIFRNEWEQTEQSLMSFISALMKFFSCTYIQSCR